MDRHTPNPALGAQDDFLRELEALKCEERIPGAMRFFKTGKGQYGEGDLFWGISVPQQQALSRKYYKAIELHDYPQLLKHSVHEVRLSALMMLVYRYQSSKPEREEVVNLYRAHFDYVNNWDLVDTSAAKILGEWLWEKDHQELKTLALSGHLWRQRISIIATHAFIRRGYFTTTLELSELLLHHPHDLIHKAVGWMLREVGNIDFQTEYAFLKQHYQTMPRTMLRYAIEKFDEPLRQDFLKGRINP